MEHVVGMRLEDLIPSTTKIRSKGSRCNKQSHRSATIVFLTMFSAAILFVNGFPSRSVNSLHSTRSSLGRFRRFSSANEEFDDFLKNVVHILEEEEKAREKKKDSKNNVVGFTSVKDGWKVIDTKALHEARKSLPKSSQQSSVAPSAVEPILIRNRLVYFKRDDQLKLAGGAPISGNKARKMVALNDLDTADFPSCIVSYGGPQSNAMLSLAAIVHFQNQKAVARQRQQQEAGQDGSEKSEKNQLGTPAEQTSLPLKRFVYYTKKLPRFLRNQPNGNLFRAKALGMELIELSSEEYGNLFGGEWGGPTQPPAIEPPVPGDSLWVCFLLLPITRRRMLT
jgi:hypothetical protein